MKNIKDQLSKLNTRCNIKINATVKLSAYILLIFTFTSSTAVAVDTDKDIISIESDIVEIERKSNIVTYKGDVKLRDKQLRIVAEQIAIARANDQITWIISLGSPARIWYREDSSNAVAIEGNSLDYDINQQQVTINGHPRLEQNDNTYRGKIDGCLKYHLENNTVSQCGELPLKYP